MKNKEVQEYCGMHIYKDNFFWVLNEEGKPVVNCITLIEARLTILCLQNKLERANT